MKDGRAIVFGPVADPAGTFGTGILNVEDPAAAAELSAQDPAILAGLGFGAQVFPMPIAVHAGT